MDDEEEEDVVGLLSQNTSEDDNTLVPQSRSGKGKGKGRVAIVDGVIESPVSVSAGAASSASTTTRIRKPSWRKALADEAAAPDTSDADGEAETDDNVEGNPPISGPVVALHPLPRNASMRRHRHQHFSAIIEVLDAQTQDALYGDRRGRAVLQGVLQFLH